MRRQAASAVALLYAQAVLEPLPSAGGPITSPALQEVVRRAALLTNGVKSCDAAGPVGVDSPIAGLVRAATPLVLEDLRVEAGGASVLLRGPPWVHGTGLEALPRRCVQVARSGFIAALGPRLLHCSMCTGCSDRA